MRPLLAILFLCVLIVAPAVDASAQAHGATGSIGIRLVDIPASAQDDPRAHAYIVDHLAPGTTIQRRVEVSNATGVDQVIHVYPAAADISAGVFVGRDGAAENDLTGWTSVADSEVRLAAGDAEQTLVTLTIPDDAPEGEYYGVIWAEVRNAASSDAAVVTASRVGVRMYLSVGAGGAPVSDFEIDAIAAVRNGGDAPAVVATVTNTGGRALDLSGVLRLENGPSSLAAGPFEAAEMTTLAPGMSGDLTVPLSGGLPAGPWTAVLEVRSGTLSHEARATVTFPDEGRATSKIEAEPSPNILLTVSVGVLLSLLVSVTAWLLFRGRRHPVR